MNVFDLFSGIGGFSLGLERAGMRTVAFCERDEYCRAVLAKHWPNVPCFKDIKHVGPAEVEELGTIDVVCGGFPCQPFSVAGKQKGSADDRHLWPRMCKVIAYARPAWVIGENVTGIIGMELDNVLADLECLGYTTRTFVIPACAVGAPHRRDRVWILANASCERRQQIAASAYGNEGANEGRPANEANKFAGGCKDASDAAAVQRRTIKRDEPYGVVRGSEDVAESTRIGWNSRRTSDATESAQWRKPNRSGERIDVADTNCEPSGRTAIAWSERDQWAFEPDVGRVAHGVPKRVDRLRCLGNAVVPQIPEIIGRAIMKQVAA